MGSKSDLLGVKMGVLLGVLLGVKKGVFWGPKRGSKLTPTGGSPGSRKVLRKSGQIRQAFPDPFLGFGVRNRLLGGILTTFGVQMGVLKEGVFLVLFIDFWVFLSILGYFGPFYRF